MPSIARQVGFAPIPVYSRQPHEDELYVMRAFAAHAKRCHQCAKPFEVHRNGGTLCDKGHQRALDVAQYAYNKGGKAYSLVDKEGNQRVQIEIPVGCEAVRDLLRAMERGLALRRKAPAVSYDENYYVQERPVVDRRPRIQVIEPSHGHRKEKTYVAGRGSLYESDMAERRQHYAEEPIIYYATPKRVPKYYHR